jgi:hypothetical protein
MMTTEYEVLLRTIKNPRELVDLTGARLYENQIMSMTAKKEHFVKPPLLDWITANIRDKWHIKLTKTSRSRKVNTSGALSPFDIAYTFVGVMSPDPYDSYLTNCQMFKNIYNVFLVFDDPSDMVLYKLIYG